MGQMIHLTSADGVQIAAYEALPAGEAKGAVVVLQEIFGLNRHIRNVADAYAQAGFFVVAPAMFHRVAAGTELGYTPDDMPKGFALKSAAEALLPLLLGDVQAAIDHAARGGKAAGAPKIHKVGIVGYCWGGLMSWRAAQTLQGLAASAPYYGGGMHKELAQPLKCPVMAHLSDQDDYVPMDGVAALQVAYPQANVHVYPAKHGFNCDERASYHDASAKLARERTLTFFAQHLV
ncbi:MAG: dienelactone hydrolase family protein [Brachymonas sp.]